MISENTYIRRQLMPELSSHLAHPEITMLVGPRQSGKTTVLQRLEAELRSRGQKTFWLNLDFEDDFRHVSSQRALLQKTQLELGKSEGVVFIDEIQRKENAGLFLKGLYDQHLPWKFVVSGSGRMVNFSELSATLGLSLATIKNYLWYLEKTYIVWKITPWFTNIRKEITKAPVYYFRDIGLRNFAMGGFGLVSDRDFGFAFQTLICAILMQRFPYADTSLHYWRTKDKAEVDFILRKGEAVTPIEVKSRDMKKMEIRRSYRGFLSRYLPSNGYIVNRSLRHDELDGETRLWCIPYWDLIFGSGIFPLY